MGRAFEPRKKEHACEECKDLCEQFEHSITFMEKRTFEKLSLKNGKLLTRETIG